MMSTSPGLQGRRARGAVADQPVVHGVPVGLRPPEPVVPLEHDLVAQQHAFEHVWAGADRRLARIVVGRDGALPVLAADHLHPHQQEGQHRLGRAGMHADRERVHDLEALDRLGRLRERRRAVQHLRHPLEREHHVVGGERRAVAEHHVGAQLELPRMVVDRCPAQRERRLGVEAGAGRHQSIEQVIRHDVVRRQVVVVRIDRRESAAGPNVQHLRPGCRPLSLGAMGQRGGGGEGGERTPGDRKGHGKLRCRATRQFQVAPAGSSRRIGAASARPCMFRARVAAPACHRSFTPARVGTGRPLGYAGSVGRRTHERT